MVRGRSGALALLALLASPIACGARTGLRVDEDEPALPAGACIFDEDCVTESPCLVAACEAGKCQTPKEISCDDGDPCTKDRCDEAKGACVFEPLAKDLDGDGVKGPAPGQSWKDPDACGHDCDDTSAKAFPGNAEVCDGVDNDCNGIVDDDAKFVPAPGEAPVLVSDPALKQAGAGGIAFAGKSAGYLAAYTGEDPKGSRVLVRPLDATGAPSGEPLSVLKDDGDGSGGPIVFTGDRYGIAWTDRRTGDYEIWFNTLAPDGKKLGPDVRLSYADGFSLAPTIAWNGTSFHVLWQDERDGFFEVWAREVSLEGAPLGKERLVAEDLGAEVPSASGSSAGMAVLYRTGDSVDSGIAFRTFDAGFEHVSAPVELVSGAVFESPYLVRSGDAYVALWVKKAPHRVFGAVLDTKGTLVVPAKELSAPGGQNRFPLALPLGDRVVLVHSRQGDDAYDLISRALDLSLQPLSEPQKITSSAGDEAAGALTFGPSGDIGVLFSGKIPKSGGGVKGAVFFSRLLCSAGAPD